MSPSTSSDRSPRPILKPSWSGNTSRTAITSSSMCSPSTTTPALPFARCTNLQPTPSLSPHVHFPPTPDLSSSQATHSASVYDRHPIDVSPNRYCLPERGGRLYVSDGEYEERRRRRIKSPKRSYFHPRAFEACQPERDDESPLDDEEVVATVTQLCPQFPEPPPLSACPGLIPDVSGAESSSDDLDSPSPPPSVLPSVSYSFARTYSQEEFDRALLFLPHPPDPTSSASKKGHQPLKKRRSLREQQHPLRESIMSDDTMVLNLPAQSNGFSCPESCLDGF